MIHLDTNILLRVGKTDPDSPKQSELARKHVQGLWDKGESVQFTVGSVQPLAEGAFLGSGGGICA